MESGSISSIDETHLARVLAHHPEAGIRLGVALCDDRWGDGSEATDRAAAAELRAWADARVAIDASEVSKRELTQLSMDQTVLEGTLTVFQWHLDRGARGTSDPDAISDRLALLVRQAWQFAGRDTERAAAFGQRLRTLDAALAGARARITHVDATLLARARTVVLPAQQLVRELASVVLRQLPGRDETLRATLMQSAEAAAKAMADHGAWLEGLSGEVGVSVPPKEALEQLLQLRRFEMDLEQLEDLAQAHIEQSRLEMRRLRRRAFKRSSLADAIATARKQTPYTAEEASAWLGELTDHSRAYCLETGLFPMTDDALVVEDSSVAMRSALGALVFLPPVRNPKTPARLLVGSPENDEGLARLSVADLEAIGARFAYPGAFLHAAISLREDSVLRCGVPLGMVAPIALGFGEDLTLGWRLHAEELLRELQFRESPPARLIVCERALIDGLLAWYDLKLVQGAISPDEATAKLVEHGGLDEATARAYVYDLVRTPLAAAGAVAGQARLLQLRRSARTTWRHGYSERRFHDLALGSGNMPVAILFGLLDEFTPFFADEGTVEYELEERPDAQAGPGDEKPSPHPTRVRNELVEGEIDDDAPTSTSPDRSATSPNHTNTVTASGEEPSADT